MDRVTVSVVIPVYNGGACLAQCLDSVRAQTLRDIEVICVDDGSTDETPAILARYAAQDPRFQVVRQENAGPGAARNTGLAQAAGEYLIFLDADDRFEPDFLEVMVARARETGADVTVCPSVEFDHATGRERDGAWMLKAGLVPGGVFTPAQAADHLFQFTYGWPWDKLYRRAFIVEAGLSYPPLPNSEDLVFVFQSLALAGQIALVDKPLVAHRMGRGGSVSNSRHRDPEVPWQALELLRDGLKVRGVYDAFEKSFLNWAMEFLVWNVANMGDRAAQRRYFYKLKGEWLPAMAFDRHPRDYYENTFTYRKYQLARYAPWPVFSGVVWLYKMLKGD